MSKLHALNNEWEFTNPQEIIKFMFLTHNTHNRVQEQLLKEVTKAKLVSDVLNISQKVEVIIHKMLMLMM